MAVPLLWLANLAYRAYAGKKTAESLYKAGKMGIKIYKAHKKEIAHNTKIFNEYWKKLSKVDKTELKKRILGFEEPTGTKGVFKIIKPTTKVEIPGVPLEMNVPALTRLYRAAKGLPDKKVAKGVIKKELTYDPKADIWKKHGGKVKKQYGGFVRKAQYDS